MRRLSSGSAISVQSVSLETDFECLDVETECFLAEEVLLALLSEPCLIILGMVLGT